LFRVGLALLFVGIGLSGFEVSCLAFAIFVGAVVTGANFVELARFKFCVGVVLSESPVGISQFFCLSGARENALLSSRGRSFCFVSGLSSFLLELGFRGFLLGFRSFLLELW
jgi:hypothetical protein